MKRMRGVTLIELMVVVTIIGILAAVAYPAYIEQARRGRRAAGVAMLQNVLQQAERYLLGAQHLHHQPDRPGISGGRRCTPSTARTPSAWPRVPPATSPPA